MNVDNDQSVASGVSAVHGQYGRLDAVVACAGWGLAGAVENTEIAEARHQFETNFWGAARLVRAALPVMRAQGAGRVVLVSSLAGLVGIPFQAFYSASKFAMEGYAEALAYEVAPFGVEVCLVQPGNVRTDFTANRRQVTPQGEDDPYRATVSKAVGKMARDEANGVPAEAVSAAIQRVLESRRPPRRRPVGKASERVGVLTKRILPFRVFEKAAKGGLGV